MDDLVKMVVEKAGISNPKAKIAVDTIITYLKAKLPGSMSAQVDAYLTGEKTSESDEMMSNLKDTLGGIYKR